VGALEPTVEKSCRNSKMHLADREHLHKHKLGGNENHRLEPRDVARHKAIAKQRR